MALLVLQQITETGTTATYSAVNASETVNPDDRVALHVKNANASPTNVTIVVPGTTYGQANPDIVTAVANATEKFIKIPPAVADPATSLITVTYSVTASVTAALVRI
jgi:phage tail sheath gpL-like